MSFPRYPQYKDSGVTWLGDVPAHWKVSQLKRVVDPERSITYGIVQAGPHVPDGIPYIRPTDMSDEHGVFTPDELMRTSPEIVSAYSRSTIRAGDLVCSIGPSFGKIMVTPKWLDGANLTQGTARLAIQTQNDARYFFWTLRSPASVAQWDSSVGGATFRALNLGPLAETSIPLPPKHEQALIAAFLDRETEKIDSLVAEQRRLMELLKEKRQSVISHAVTKGLNPDVSIKLSGIEWLGQLPSHWGFASLTRIANRVVVGIAEAATHAYADEGIPILRSTNIRAGRIVGDILFVDPVFAQDRGSKLINAGDLVTVRTGNAGVTAVIPKSLDGCQCFTMLITSLGAGSIAAYYCYWMNSVSAKRYFSLEGWGTAQVNISVPILKALPIPIPPTSEQLEVVSFLDREIDKIDALVHEAQRAIDLLLERRSALISAAVTGQIDVRGLVEPVAA